VNLVAADPAVRSGCQLGLCFERQHSKLLLCRIRYDLQMTMENIPKIFFCCCTQHRVTRLVKFSPIGRVFTSGSLSEITKVSQKIRASFFHGKSYLLILTKNGVGRFSHKLIWSP
jgi:hypothetical protein